MPLFAVIGLDVADSTPLRERHRAAHRSYVTANDGPIRFAGALCDPSGRQCGSLYVFEAPDAAAVQAWFAQEAFRREGIYRQFEVFDMKLALNRLPALLDLVPPVVSIPAAPV